MLRPIALRLLFLLLLLLLLLLRRRRRRRLLLIVGLFSGLRVTVAVKNKRRGQLNNGHYYREKLQVSFLLVHTLAE